MGKRQHSFLSRRDDRPRDEACRIHSCQRLQQRYGVQDVLDQRLAYERHAQAVREGRHELVGTRVEDGSLICRVTEARRRFYLAWDPALMLIATYLTEEQALCHADRSHPPGDCSRRTSPASPSGCSSRAA